MEKLESQKNKDKDAKISKIILAKILEMPLTRYFIYVQKIIGETGDPFLTVETFKKTILCESND